MEEYRVLLADDEEEIRTGISRKIDWASLGFSLAGEAGNGEEALDLLRENPDARVALLDIMRRAAEFVEKEGITLVIEPLNTKVNHPGYHLSTSEDSFDLIDRIGSKQVKILFDIYHQQITEGDLIRNITENIDKIGHFHAAGNPGRNEITKGEIAYRHVFEAIKALGYDRYVGLEYMVDCDPLPGLIEARETVLV